MYLILDLVYIVEDYFEPLLCYFKSIKHYYIVNKITQKYIEFYTGVNSSWYTWGDLLNNTTCINWDRNLLKDLEDSNKRIKFDPKIIKIPMDEKNFLFNKFKFKLK